MNLISKYSILHSDMLKLSHLGIDQPTLCIASESYWFIAWRFSLISQKN